jgi:hypothetical protein
VQPSDFKIVYGQRADTPALQSKRANGEASDGERTDRGGREGKRAECDRSEAEGVIDARRPLAFRAVASRRLNRVHSSLAHLSVVHGAPRSSAIGFDDLVKRSELLIEGQGQRELALL